MELLIVIAVIGIITSVGVISLNSARDKAKRGAMKQTMINVQPIILSCIYDDNALCPDCVILEGGLSRRPATDKPICAGEQNWPTPTEGWQWTSITTNANQDFTLVTYLIGSADPLEYIICGAVGGCIDFELTLPMW